MLAATFLMSKVSPNSRSALDHLGLATDYSPQFVVLLAVD